MANGEAVSQASEAAGEDEVLCGAGSQSSAFPAVAVAVAAAVLGGAVLQSSAFPAVAVVVAVAVLGGAVS